jgi:hypothetical protein
MTNANDNLQGKKVSSLRDLPRSIEPPRDLWAGIEARIAAERPPVVQAPAKRGSVTHLRWIAAAAMLAALAVGVWIGRGFSPHTGPQYPHEFSPNVIQAAYFADPKFRAQRTELLKSLEAKLATLPPESREKVTASLTAIHNSMHVLEQELGKDPTNALLQELLLNTYQDEMRVLTTVHEASDAGRGI